MTTLQYLAKAVISAFIRADHSFSTMDVVHCINEAVGPETKTRTYVLEDLRERVKSGSLKSLGVKSPAGYGWLYYSKSPMIPSGFQLKSEMAKATKTKKEPTKTSQEWLVDKGWTLPEEGPPSGWNMADFYNSFYVEQITDQEFMKRWNFSYDPSQKIEVTEEFGKSFMKAINSFLGAKDPIDLSDSLQAFCLDRPDIEGLAVNLEMNKVVKHFKKTDWINQAGDCSTVGELVGLAYQLSESDGPVPA